MDSLGRVSMKVSVGPGTERSSFIQSRKERSSTRAPPLSDSGRGALGRETPGAKTPVICAGTLLRDRHRVGGRAAG